MNRAILMVAAYCGLTTATAWPSDQIYTNSAKKVRFGKIASMSATAIGFQPQNEPAIEIPTNEIVRIVFENSPAGLLAAQEAILHGDYEKAIDALKKEVPEENRREVADEITFCRAYSAAQLALSGTANPEEAGGQLYSFISNSPNNFHFLKACELMGDICVTIGKFTDAQKYYTKLAEAPWPDYKIRAQVAAGRAFLAQNKPAEADKAFEDALANSAPGELAESQRIAARIGKDRCRVLTGKLDLALRDLNEVLDRLEEDNSEINALVYNALGTALRKSGKPKEAIYAFLRVHLKYNSQPDLDAEAVANLENLFTETHKPNHARDMREILNEKYQNSRWAKGVK
jgi:tetratricopeptide (TPR) repeat protein